MFEVDWKNIRRIRKKRTPNVKPYPRNYYEFRDKKGNVVGSAKQVVRATNLATDLSSIYGLLTVFHNGGKYQLYDNGIFLGWLNGYQDPHRYWLNLE